MKRSPCTRGTVGITPRTCGRRSTVADDSGRGSRGGLGIRNPSWQSSCIRSRSGIAMLLTIIFVCGLLWLLGMMTTTTFGGLLHVLLVIAIILFLVHIIQGSSIGNA